MDTIQGLAAAIAVFLIAYFLPAPKHGNGSTESSAPSYPRFLVRLILIVFGSMIAHSAIYPEPELPKAPLVPIGTSVFNNQSAPSISIKNGEKTRSEQTNPYAK